MLGAGMAERSRCASPRNGALAAKDAGGYWVSGSAAAWYGRAFS